MTAMMTKMAQSMATVAGTHRQATAPPCLRSGLFLYAQRCLPPHTPLPPPWKQNYGKKCLNKSIVSYFHFTIQLQAHFLSSGTGSPSWWPENPLAWGRQGELRLELPFTSSLELTRDELIPVPVPRYWEKSQKIAHFEMVSLEPLLKYFALKRPKRLLQPNLGYEGTGVKS